MLKTENQIKEQYKNSSNLDARIAIHELYSTNKEDWHLWLMDQYVIPEHASILELGCGNGAFWAKNKSKINKNWNITLSDFSEGMLNDARSNIGVLPNVHYKHINITDIPYAEHSFDVVIANHMLYHVPDVQKGLSEVRRVLKPNGTFYASTIGEKHMSELNTLLTEFDSRYTFLSAHYHSSKFGLENGEKQLNELFSTIQLNEFEGGLEITEAEPLIQYILSAGSEHFSSDEKIKEFSSYIKRKLDDCDGKLYITKSTGLFEVK